MKLNFYHVSFRATGNIEEGHYYSIYEKFNRFFSDVNSQQTASIIRIDSNLTHSINLLEPINSKSNIFLFNKNIKLNAHNLNAFYKSKILEKEDPVLVFYEGDEYEFLLALNILRLNPNSKIIFNFHHGYKWAKIINGKNLINFMFNFAFNKFYKFPNVVVSAESFKLARLFERKFETKVEEFPILSAFDPTTKTITKSKSKDVDLLLLPKEGLDIQYCLKAIKYLVLGNTNLKIHLHISSIPYNSEILRAANPQNSSNIQISFGYLPQDEYLELLARSRFTCFPYFGDFYEWGSSGRVNDAILQKSIPLVPSHTALTYSFGRPIPHFSLDNFSELEMAINNHNSKNKLPILSPVLVSDYFDWLLSLTKLEFNSSKSTTIKFNDIQIFLIKLWIFSITNLRAQIAKFLKKVNMYTIYIKYLKHS